MNDFSKNPFVCFTIIVIAGILIGKFFVPFLPSLYILSALLFLSIVVYFLPQFKNKVHLLFILALLFASSVRFNQVTTILPDNHIIFQDLSQIKELTGIITQAKYKSDGKNKYTLFLDLNHKY